MTYTPINWQTGDTITAEKMNKMDNGWSVSDTQLFSETVTTAESEGLNSAMLLYAGTDCPANLQIKFANVDYDCPLQEAENYCVYGAPSPMDFSTYPFALVYQEGSWIIFTESAGTYSITASSVDAEVSLGFNAAVNECLGSGLFPMLCIDGVTTFDEMESAKQKNRLMYFYDQRGMCSFITNMSSTPITILSSYDGISASFDNDNIFTITYN